MAVDEADDGALVVGEVVGGRVAKDPLVVVAVAGEPARGVIGVVIGHGGGAIEFGDGPAGVDEVHGVAGGVRDGRQGVVTVGGRGGSVQPLALSGPLLTARSSGRC